MKFGLKENDLKYLLNSFKHFDEIKAVKIFGSRAMGNFKEGSDIDLAIFGLHKDSNIPSKLKSLLEEEGPLPYFADIVSFESIDNKNLIKHIEEHGIEIYSQH